MESINYIKSCFNQTNWGDFTSQSCLTTQGNMGWVGLKRMILRHRGSVLRRSFLTGVFFSERQDRRKNFKPDKKKWNAKVFAFFLQLNVKLKPSALSVPHCLFRLAARMENRLGQTETRPSRKSKNVERLANRVII